MMRQVPSFSSERYPPYDSTHHVMHVTSATSACPHAIVSQSETLARETLRPRPQVMPSVSGWRARSQPLRYSVYEHWQVG